MRYNLVSLIFKLVKQSLVLYSVKITLFCLFPIAHLTL